MSGHAHDQQNENHFHTVNAHKEQPNLDDIMDLDTFELHNTVSPGPSYHGHNHDDEHPSTAEGTEARQATLNAAMALAGLTEVNGERFQTTHDFLAHSQHGPAPSEAANAFIADLHSEYATSYAPWTDLFRGGNDTLLATHQVPTIDPSLLSRTSGDGGVGAPTVDSAVIAHEFQSCGVGVPNAMPPSTIDPPAAPATLPLQPLPTTTIPVPPSTRTPTLIGFFANRPQESRMLKRARSYADHPDRIVHQPTDPGACKQCREKGVECATVLGKKHCAYCTSLGGFRQFYCSTADERMRAEGRDGDGRARQYVWVEE